MVDIFHKLPDTRKKRWWAIPIPTKRYKDNYNNIFKKKPKVTDEDIKRAEERYELSKYNDCIGGHKIIKDNRRELYRLKRLKKEQNL